MDDPSFEKQRFLREAVFGIKNIVVKSLKTDWCDNKVEIGLTDGEDTLFINVDLDDARLVRKGNTDAA